MQNLITLTLLSLLVPSTLCLSLLLQDSRSQCFSVLAKRENELRVGYVLLGQGEDQVEFTIKYKESQETIYQTQNKKENDVVIKATRDASVELCWRRLDNKAKKLTFNFQVMDSRSDKLAGTDTVEHLFHELKQVGKRLDGVSRNIYMQCLVTSSSASGQTWMSVLKMVLVIAICSGQVFFITKFFQTNSKKGQYNQMTPGSFINRGTI